MKRQIQTKFRLFGWLGLIAIFTITACEKEESFEVTPVNFKVTASATSLTMEDAVTYADSSRNVAKRTWTFEGGDVSTSEAETVDVTYNEAGRFATTLNVEFTDGTSEERLFYVDVEPFVETNFVADKTTILFGNTIQFTNLTANLDPEMNSFPDSDKAKAGLELETWVWEFEGGIPATSTEMNPVVRYLETGTFKVSLIANRNYPEHSDTEVKEAYINVVDVNVLSPIATKSCGLGSEVYLTYEEELTSLDEEAVAGFEVLVDGAATPITSAEIDPNDPNSYLFRLETPVLEGQSIAVNFDGRVIETAVGSLLAPLDGISVENSVVNNFTGNMGFENGNVGAFPPDWGTWNPDQSANNNQFYEIIDTDVVSGSQALKVSYDGLGEQWIFDNKTPVPVIDQGVYRVSFWAKSSVEGTTLDLKVIESGWATFDDADDFVLTTEWKQYSYDFTASADGKMDRKIWWRIFNIMEPFDMYVDDIKMYYLGCE
ncbi:MAG: hypothetical protein AAGG68_12865 [Bacteroidota bacterium]